MKTTHFNIRSAKNLAVHRKYQATRRVFKSLSALKKYIENVGGKHLCSVSNAFGRPYDLYQLAVTPDIAGTFTGCNYPPRINLRSEVEQLRWLARHDMMIQSTSPMEFDEFCHFYNGNRRCNVIVQEGVTVTCLVAVGVPLEMKAVVDEVERRTTQATLALEGCEISNEEHRMLNSLLNPCLRSSSMPKHIRTAAYRKYADPIRRVCRAIDESKLDKNLRNRSPIRAMFIRAIVCGESVDEVVQFIDDMQNLKDVRGSDYRRAAVLLREYVMTAVEKKISSSGTVRRDFRKVTEYALYNYLRKEPVRCLAEPVEPIYKIEEDNFWEQVPAVGGTVITATGKETPARHKLGSKDIDDAVAILGVK